MRPPTTAKVVTSSITMKVLRRQEDLEAGPAQPRQVRRLRRLPRTRQTTRQVE